MNSSHFRVNEEVHSALESGRPVVALETAVVTHGLPPPYNVAVVDAMQGAIRAVGAIPAVCLVTGGCLVVGASAAQIHGAANDPKRDKASVRDLAAAIASHGSAGLTVSATLHTAALAGIRVFATGGIGGVHTDSSSSGDISADLPQLAKSPVITVCSGAKSVLDIPRTLEFLETLGVPVFSFGANEFPAFYLQTSGLRTPTVASPSDVSQIAHLHWALQNESGILIGNPIDRAHALDPAEWREWLNSANQAAISASVQGKAMTPFLLDQVARASGGRTVQANIALLESNARLAAEIAVALLA